MTTDSDRTLNVLFLAIGARTRPSSRFRVHSWIPFLEQEGVRCKLIEFWPHLRSWSFVPRRLAPIGRWARNRLSGKRAQRELIAQADWADVVVVQEALISRRTAAALKRIGKPVIFDFSDPVHLTRFGGLESLIHRFVLRPRFERLIDVSSAIIVENDLLTGLATSRHKDAYVIRGPIDTSVFRPKDKGINDELVIGWTGSPGTFGYLEPILPGLRSQAFVQS
jgi:hypothetical protein